MAIAKYTNAALDQRLDLLANEMSEISKQAILSMQINDRTNLIQTDVQSGQTVTVSNVVVLHDRQIQIYLSNKSKFPALKGCVDFLAKIDATNVDCPGWIPQPSDTLGNNHWRYDVDRSIAKDHAWHISTVTLSTNYSGKSFIGRFETDADNSEALDYLIQFVVE